MWDDGGLSLGPLVLDEAEPIPDAGTPISRALARLGVERGDQFDEFDAAGLGRHRATSDWRP